MTHQFRPRKNMRQRGGGGRQREGLPRPDLQSDLESLPETDYNLFDRMDPATLLKAAKDAKLSPNLLRHELIEQLLSISNQEAGAIYAKGILEILNDGWGFLRRENYSPSIEDVYVSQSQIKRFWLRPGDVVFGQVRLPKEGEKYKGMLRVESCNGSGTASPEMQR